MIEPLRAMQVIVAPLPRSMTVPTGIAIGAPAVVVRPRRRSIRSAHDDA